MALDKSIASGDDQNLAAVYDNMGSLYDDQKKYDKALEFANKALELNKRLGNRQGESVNYGNIASVYKSLHQAEKTVKFTWMSLSIAKEIGSPGLLKNCHELLYSVYENDQPDSALTHFILSSQYNDTLVSEQTDRASVQQEIKFNYEKKAAADSVKAMEDKRVAGALLAESEATLNKDRITRILLYCGMGMVVLFSLFMINRFRLTNRQKKLIEEQKKLVEEQKEVLELKQKEILDSIYYAKRIQTALLTNEKYIEKVLKNKRR
jgi:tetratricopeptide (TPR) repeat protein